MNCKYLSKSLKGDLKCKLYKRHINYPLECKNCLNRILVKNKGIKKVSKKKITVSEETYKKVYERDNGCCRICGNRNIQLHHIIYRSEDKRLIDCVENCIMLCFKCHRMVHSNKHFWQTKLKKLIQ